MCGIIGYTGRLDASKVLLTGLTQLEYRGYDSAGIAVLPEDGKETILIKAVGKVAALSQKAEGAVTDAHCGIGHTRWATHGGVTEENAHPHRAGCVTLIHNGIIENCQAISREYGFAGSLISETDSEVAAMLLDKLYEGCPEEAIIKLTKLVEGSYAFGILFSDQPGKIYAVRSVSPLVAAYTPDGAFLASDLTALIPYTKSYFVVPEHKIVILSQDGIVVQDFHGKKEQPELLEVTWNTDAAMKNGYPHFMLKEIHEQPEALNNTILPRLKDGLPDFTADHIPDDLFTGKSRIQIIACGTAKHAGMAARALMEPLLRIPVQVSIASEFRYEDPLIDENTLAIVISQSGETIDTLAALRLAKERSAKVLSVVNVKGSSIARESDYVLYTHAGPEIAVASTKAYSVQLAALYLVGCRMALLNNRYTKKEAREFISQLMQAIPAMNIMMEKKDSIHHAVSFITKQHDAFFIGRGLDYSFSLEGALKLKEISYIHAEAYAAGELKHGTIALISEGVPVVALATQDRIYNKTISNIREVKARGAFVILFTKEGTPVEPGVCDLHITIPQMDDRFTVFPLIVALQLIAYYGAVDKELDVDQPRNLAKSVTVE